MQKCLSLGRLVWFFVGFMVLWVGAWLTALAFGLSTTTPYWIGAKAAVWVLYPLLFWRVSVREHMRFIGLAPRPGLGED